MKDKKQTDRERRGLAQCKKRDGTINRSRRTGEPCNANPVGGLPFCYHHGGKSLRGQSSPSYKHGGYSVYLKGAIQKKYEAAFSDDERLSLMDDIVLDRARILLALEETEKESSLFEIFESMDTIRSRAEAGSMKKSTAVQQIMSLVKRGADQAARWKHIAELQEHRRRLIETEARIMAITEKNVTAEEMVFLINRFVDIIHQNVDDRGTLNKITQGIEKTMASGSLGRA